jgi:regulatory protein
MTEVFNAAVALLAWREHGAIELADKLVKKGHSAEEVQTAIAACQSLDLQSDRRFVDMLLRVRIGQGYGPERIRSEIQQKKVDCALYEQALEEEPVDWLGCAQRVLDKKYKSCAQLSWQIQQKQKNFLLYRGFSPQIIAQLFKINEEMTR